MNQNSQPYIKKHVYSLLHKTIWASLDFSLQTNSETSGGGYWFDSYPDRQLYPVGVSSTNESHWTGLLCIPGVVAL